jgi:hypothetical protein
MLPGVVLALVCVFVCGETAAARDVALVTGKNSPVKAVKSADLAKTIKTTHKWPDGPDLTIVLTDPSSPEMRIVAEKLLEPVHKLRQRNLASYRRGSGSGLASKHVSQ